MANQLFAGFAYNNVGDPIASATVNLYDRNTTTPVRATTTTDANGYWAISHATEGRFDVEIVSGTTKRRRKYDDSVQLETIEVAVFRMRNPADTFDYDIVPGAITADRQLNLPVITATDTLMSLGLAQTITALKSFDGIPVRFTTGVAMTAGQYEVARDADGTNQLHFNIPTGATFEFSVNDVAQLVLGASSLTGNVVGTGASQVAQGSHTHTGTDISAGVKNSATQSITSGADTVVTYDTENFDTDNIHSTVSNTGRLTCNTAGKYIVTAKVVWQANATGSRFAQIVINETSSVAESRIDVANSVAHAHSISCILSLVVNDYLQVHVTQNSGGALTVAAGDTGAPSFSMAKILG